MIKYVTGYVLSEDLKRVLLIRKNRPEKQNGKLNGIGGKRERKILDEGVGDEHELYAICREFEEETGVKTFYYDWTHADKLYNDNFELDIYYCVSNKFLESAKTMETEEVGIYDISSLFGREDLMNTVEWVIRKILFLIENKVKSL